jgi:signal transduction histidine kinase
MPKLAGGLNAVQANRRDVGVEGRAVSKSKIYTAYSEGFPGGGQISWLAPFPAVEARRPRAAETLLAVSHAISSRQTPFEILTRTVHELVRALDADTGSVWPFDPAGFPAVFLDGSRANEPLCSSDSAHDARLDHPVLKLVPHKSVLIQPLHVRGAIAAYLVFVWIRCRHAFSEVELRLVEAATEQTCVALENASLFTELKRRSGRLQRVCRELRSSRARLRALSTHVERVREQERGRIAREIHDELGQALTSLKIDLSRLGRRQNEGSEVGELSAAVDGMMATVRRIASELRPHLLDDLGLLAALESHAQDFVNRTAVKCRFRCRGTPGEVDADRSTALFRIFQEMLTNIARHAHATRVHITLIVRRASVSLEVQDNGRGMPEPPRSNEQRLGLLGMQERAAGFGGRVRISKVSPHGTRVRVHIPLGQRREGQR